MRNVSPDSVNEEDEKKNHEQKYEKDREGGGNSTDKFWESGPLEMGKSIWGKLLIFLPTWRGKNMGRGKIPKKAKKRFYGEIQVG